MSTPPDSEYVAIARIRKTHGRRGEVAVEILTDFLERFRPGERIWLSNEKPARALVLEACRFHKGLAILKFQGIETLSAAESFIGRQVQVPRAERRTAPGGSVYVSDLIGCAVLEHSLSLGTVQALEETGGVPLLRVDTAEGELLIPFAQEICAAVDVDRKEIFVNLPEGLRELNREKPDRLRRRNRRRTRRRHQQ